MRSGPLVLVVASLLGCGAERPAARAPEAVVLVPPVASVQAVAPAPLRALAHAEYVAGSPCELRLDAPREPTEQELLALLLPELDVESLVLPEHVTPFPAWEVRLCRGRPLSSTERTSLGARERLVVPAFAGIVWPDDGSTLVAMRVTLAPSVTLTVLARRIGADVKLIGVTDQARLALRPMVHARLGTLDGVLREREWMVTFRGHSGRFLEFLPEDHDADRGVFSGADDVVNTFAGDVVIGVQFSREVNHGWAPPWVGEMSVARLQLLPDALVVDEDWRFVHARDGRVTRRHVTRRYTAEERSLVESPPLDDLSRWPEVTEGVGQ